jgi:hypothetical protein
MASLKSLSIESTTLLEAAGADVSSPKPSDTALSSLSDNSSSTGCACHAVISGGVDPFETLTKQPDFSYRSWSVSLRKGSETSQGSRLLPPTGVLSSLSHCPLI